MQVIDVPFVKGLIVPNAVSPEFGSGDALLFLPKGTGLIEYFVEVFSPWGERLWYSDLLIDGQPGEGWDGYYKGQLMPQDVYVWKIRAVFKDGTLWDGMSRRGGRRLTFGSVTLLR